MSMFKSNVEMSHEVSEAFVKVGAGMRALGMIHKLMDGEEWSPDTLDEIATLLDNAGYEIHTPGFYEEVDEPVWDEPQQWYLGAHLNIDVMRGDDNKPVVKRVTVLPYQENFVEDDGGISGFYNSDDINEALFKYMDDHRSLNDDSEELFALSWST